MGDFYARWMNDPKDGKAEALREAQLALLHGAPVATQTGRARGPHLDEEAPPVRQTNDYSHPYYWAPFVLVGNFQ
jgi:CHAT domain-containing protein